MDNYFQIFLYQERFTKAHTDWHQHLFLGPVSDATMEISLLSEEGATSPLMSPLMGGSVDAEFSCIGQKELINSPLEPIPCIFPSSSSPSRFMDRMVCPLGAMLG